MAVFQTEAPLRNGGFVSIATLRNLFDTVWAWNEARMTRQALMQLNDRELTDIGLSRADIESGLFQRSR